MSPKSTIPLLFTAAAAALTISTAHADVVLKASHQIPGGKGDVRLGHRLPLRVS